MGGRIRWVVGCVDWRVSLSVEFCWVEGCDAGGGMHWVVGCCGCLMVSNGNEFR